jgi:hypothetical protein
MSKGSRRRPTNVPLEQSDANFENIFGKRVPTYLKNRIHEANTDSLTEQNGSNPNNNTPKDNE